jgi:polar amino acid transport system substrate-binding protein
MNLLRAPLTTAFSITLLFLTSIPIMAQSDINAEMIPTGKLRMGINGSNATLYTRAADGSAAGIAVDIGKFIAAKLGVPFEPVVYSGAATYTASFGTGEWDLIVTGRNPLAAQRVDFLPDVILIDYVYVAAPGRDFAGPDQVDRVGVKIGVPRNASADAFLSQRLKAAELVRVAGDANAVTTMLRDGKIDLYASGIDSLTRIANNLPGAKIIGTFDTVAFAVSVAKGWSPAARQRLTQLVNEAKDAGIVQRAIDAARLNGVKAAPR